MKAVIDPQADVRDLVIAIFRANGAVIARGDRLVADLGLTSSLWQGLDALHRAKDSLTVADIGRAMGLTRQSVQRSADILAERGLIGFRDNPAHKRARLADLTDEGARVLARIHERDTVTIARVLEHIPAGEIAAAAGVLAAFAHELTRDLPSGDDR